MLKRSVGTAGALLFAIQLLRFGNNPPFRLINIASKVVLGLLFFVGTWWSFLGCPRCGERYRAWYAGDLDYFGDDCQNCRLTRGELSSIARPPD